MALIQCPDCDKNFSDQAQACPNCGRPFKRQQSLLTKELGFDGFIFGVMIIAGIFVAPTPYNFLLIIAGLVFLVAKLVK